ncbi:EAL domain-containing protein [Ferrimonas balearica]|uniref:EAL domain-containing protein n=1 Tax=Ferrimonas balearica TaxID=44012 RepID=UPI001C98E62A|nr:EAL domain-containing protein [Ferrimonas balearica]MBY5922114.1 EAL domain-containing protein [Ferrimonas balearica]MBY5994546.1 EAL domain-containing protein [Ferrimonas balearica]
MKPWIALLLLCISLTVDASGLQLTPTYTLSEYGRAQNLSESSVTSIVQDQHGFIWVGTINGLNRFDGSTFKLYHSSNQKEYGLRHNTVRALHLDSSGNLWVVTNQQIYQYNAQKDHFEPFNVPFEKKFWTIETTEQHVFVGTDSGLIIQDRVRGQFELATKTEPFGISEIHLFSSQTLILTTNQSEGIVYNHGAHRFEALPIQGQVKAFFNLTEDLNLVVTNSGLYLLNASGQARYTLPTSPIHKAAIDRENGKVYFASGKKIFYATVDLYDGAIATPQPMHLDMETEPSHLFLDRNNDLWVGVIGTGLIKISTGTSELTHYTNICGNKSCDQVWSIDNFNGLTWIANDTEKLVAFDANMVVTQEHDTGIVGPKTIHADGESIFVGGKNRLYILQGGREYSFNFDDTIITSITSVNSAKLLGTFSEGIILLDENGQLLKDRFEPQVDSTALALNVDDSKVFIGTQTGLHIYRFNPRLGIWEKSGHLLKEQIVTAIETVSNGYVIGTVSSGFHYLDRKLKLSKLDIDLRDQDNLLIYSIVSTESALYASSNYGILKIAPDSLKLLDIYGYARGAQKEFNGMSADSTDDKIYFGGTNGINILKDAASNRYASSFAPVFTYLRVFDKEVTPGSKITQNITTSDRITLEYSDYPFTIGVSRLAGKFSESIVYQYRLLGFDNDWKQVDSANMSITFSKLPPGRYILEADTVTPFSKDQHNRRSITIVIRPPWWLSPQAKFVYGLIILLMVIALYREMLRRRRVQARIAQSEERLKLSLWGSGDEMWDWDMEAGKIYRSNIWGILEFPQDGQRNGSGSSNIHPDDLNRVNQLLNDHFSGESEHFEATYRVKSKTGEWVWILDRAKIVERDEQGRPTRMTGTIKDISSIKEAEERLNLFARALRNISEGMFILDNEMRYLEVNEACLEITGFNKSHFINDELNFDRYPRAYTDDIIRIVRQQGRWNGELELTRSNGRLIQIELTLDQIKEGGTHNHFYVGVFSDITHRKQAESELRRLTNNDVLTGLPNRSYLQISLDSLVRRQVPLCLLIFDLDNFKKVNDSLGHVAGDALLCHVANRVRNHLPEEASLYRLGGDEFAVIYDGERAINQSTKLAQEILSAFSQPFQLEQGELVVNTSIGIVTYPDDDVDRQALLRKADLAMYHAKGQGGQCYQFFNESLNQAAMVRLDTENLIRQALKDNFFEVYYQPKVDLRTQSIKGMEALVRLNHPSKGLISPGEFIPLAEETGLIVEIGEYVLKQACFAAEKWRRMGLLNGRVAVNLSSHQFTLPDLCERIERILKLTRLPAECLELEITEGTVIQHPDQAIATMSSLHNLGIHLALDDFGTGYSSLSYLKRFPINTLKIDKSFVDDIAVTTKDRMMAASIITIARNMELQVVAEGVEHQSQLDILRELQCDVVQGYLFSKPVPEAVFEKAISENRVLANA